MGPDAYNGAEVVDAMNAKAGYIWQMGALDFAGGTVVHINAAVAGLVGAYMAGKRVGYGKEHITPHSLTLTMVGAALLWTLEKGLGDAWTPDLADAWGTAYGTLSNFMIAEAYGQAQAAE